LALPEHDVPFHYSEDFVMPDDKSIRGSQDRKRISLNEDYEVRYWSKKFGVSKEELKAAVKRAGHSAAAVERELKKKAA
jgi:hypothetical protein